MAAASIFRRSSLRSAATSQSTELSDRLRFHAGNFFSDPLPSADVLIMGRVLHNWDLPTKQMLLQKAYRALPEDGAIIVYERLIDDARRTNASGMLSSLNMLVMTSGGFDFTSADCMAWMHAAGFQRMRVEALTGDHSMVVGYKEPVEALWASIGKAGH